MDDKYQKEYSKKHSQSQFHQQLDEKWSTSRTANATWEHEKSNLKKPKPDPATVEAELQLEEQLWAS